MTKYTIVWIEVTDTRALASVTVLPTDEKLSFDCAEVAEIASSRRATCDSNGSSLDCFFMSWSGDWCAADMRKAVLCQFIVEWSGRWVGSIGRWRVITQISKWIDDLWLLCVGFSNTTTQTTTNISNWVKNMAYLPASEQKLVGF